MRTPDAPSIPDITAAAIEFLARQGYDATTVGDLAEATGMSRSTYFRRFGSKEDVVFADHDFLLQRVELMLHEATGKPLAVVAAAARMVLDHHLRRPDIARFRYGLLQENPVLRDRELVTSHRYERAFAAYLREALPQAADREWALVAYAASVVALHNHILRAWLRGRIEHAAEAFDADAAELESGFGDMLDPGRPAKAAPARVVVAVIEPDATPAEVLRTIAGSLDA